MRRFAPALLQVLLSLLIALAFLAAVEGLLRLVKVRVAGQASVPQWMDPETAEFLAKWTAQRGISLTDVADLAGWDRDPALRWRLKPNLQMTARNIFVDQDRDMWTTWRLTTNSRGFRTPEFSPARTPGTLRVVVLGDSNSMGWLLDDDNTYPRRLEAHLAALSGRRVEVINLGVGNYTSFSVRRLFTQVALPLAPDAVVLSFGANDSQQMRSTDAEYAAMFAGASGRFRHWLSQLRLAGLAQRLFPARTSGLVPRVPPDDFAANLEGILAETTRLSLPVVFLKVCCCSKEYHDRLLDVLNRSRTPLLDANDVLRQSLQDRSVQESSHQIVAGIAALYPAQERAENPDLQVYFRDLCHLNPFGADLIARRIAAALTERLGTARQ